MTYLLDPPGKTKKKTSFIPRLAFGTVSIGAGVIPLIVAISGCGDSDTDAIYPAQLDSGTDGVGVRLEDAQTNAVYADAQMNGIVPYDPMDAATDAIYPYIAPDSGLDAAADAGDAAEDGGDAEADADAAEH